jgi:hypothetical protein
MFTTTRYSASPSKEIADDVRQSASRHILANKITAQSTTNQQDGSCISCPSSIFASRLILANKITARSTTNQQLLDGGDHLPREERVLRRNTERRAIYSTDDGLLPRDLLHEQVIEKDLSRPRPPSWK